MPLDECVLAHDSNFPLIGLREMVSYGCGDFASNLFWGTTGAYLMYFYVDVCRIAPVDVAVLLLCTRMLDALIDPAVGYVIDKSGGSLVRPLIKWLAVPFGILAFLTFLPLGLGQTRELIWAYTTYTVAGLVYSGVNTPYGVLGNLMTRDSADRVGLGVSRMIGCQGALLIVALTTIPVVQLLGGGTGHLAEMRGFPMYMACAGLVGTLMWFITYRGCVQRVSVPSTSPRFAILLRALAQNTPWQLCTVGFALSFFLICSYTSFAIYYAKVVLGRDAQFGSYLLLLNTICNLLGSASVPSLSRWLGRKRLLLMGYIIQITALSVLLLNPASIPLLIICCTVAWYHQGFCSASYYAMISDVIDYGTAVSGVRVAGVAYSITSLSTKVGFAIAGSFLAGMLSWGQYRAGIALQSPGASASIVAGFILMPIAICMISAVAVWRYPSDELMREMVQNS